MCKAIDITKKSFELSRKKATEILMFLLSTSDREKSANGIEQTPIAYAMKGSSLSTNVMRNLIEKVLDECKERNVSILCECCDGQWWKNVFCDIDGNPLTRMQYQKQVWNEVLQIKKNEIINYLIKCSTVSESMLKNISEQKHILMVPGTYNEGNISITSDISTNVQGNKESKLFVMSNGGNIASEALM